MTEYPAPTQTKYGPRTWRVNAIRFYCPACRSVPGEPCRNGHGNPMEGSHAARHKRGAELYESEGSWERAWASEVVEGDLRPDDPRACAPTGSA